MTFFYGVTLCCLLFSCSINCSPSLRRATSNFTLYAYASDGTFGGVPVFYADGKLLETRLWERTDIVLRSGLHWTDCTYECFNCKQCDVFREWKRLISLGDRFGACSDQHHWPKLRHRSRERCVQFSTICEQQLLVFDHQWIHVLRLARVLGLFE